MFNTINEQTDAVSTSIAESTHGMLSIQGVSKQYNNDHWGLRGFTREVGPGVPGIPGPNGAVEYGIVGPKILVTAIHGLLVVLHLVSFFLVRDPLITETIQPEMKKKSAQ
ncbi:MAG: hypothetical protein MHPDNHAH_00083 [Anaerolineales bacterium]|nr:hypothetical protein [Anaerolineales bacterium]WKZ47054.1 MAG: hypothetical protein QY306_14660 [Anaerolineales bacterium]